MSSVRQAGRVFHSFSVEVGKTGLALADGSDRRIEDRDIHVSSANREMTITLQVVAVLPGLRIDGPPVTGTHDMDWAMECKRLLGVRPR